MRSASHARIDAVLELELTADRLVSALLGTSASRRVCILDSCGVGHLGSHLLVAGVAPVDVVEVSNSDPHETLKRLDEVPADHAAIFTLSYDLGVRLLGVRADPHRDHNVEPDLFLATFDALIFHDYDSGRTFLTGNEARYEEISNELRRVAWPTDEASDQPQLTSNFTKAQYVSAIETIKERIRAGDTYQANLTQQMSCPLPKAATPEGIFLRLRHDHPAPFAAFLRRERSTVVSASPERFLRTTRRGDIESSPIKGTRPRGTTRAEDESFRKELENSAKDRAENTMIVDLIRNDLGRVCEFGSVVVDKLCDVEEHPTLFHLVSTVRGQLRENARFSDILLATFPCGSITGAPKISTMRIIDEIEPDRRGLSMGAIGIRYPDGWKLDNLIGDTAVDMNVAIRTMVVRERKITFNVGGGIVIDSDPASEYEESLLKAEALLRALGKR